MISTNRFNLTHVEYDKLEKRGSFYPMSLRMIDKGFKVEALLFILSTWNMACFRYAMNNFDINGFRETIRSLEPYFNKFRNEEFSKMNLDSYENDIKSIFAELYKIKGVQSTGASKVMHLCNPKVFVMWDGYIRNSYGFKDGDADNYFDFLKKMQSEFKNVKWNGEDVTFAKAIDEYNYVKFTLPGLASRRKNK